jgi:hypothetical protein
MIALAMDAAPEPEPEPEVVEEIDAVPVLVAEAHVLEPRPQSASAIVAKQAAAVAATSFAAGVATVAAVRVGRAVRAKRRARKMAPVLATRSFLVDVHLLGSRD